MQHCPRDRLILEAANAGSWSGAARRQAVELGGGSGRMGDARGRGAGREQQERGNEGPPSRSA
eukprot:scaffold137126_cov211-Phaeocystis_antarctica.AAC.1